jgi:hypothetical protein
LWKKSFVVAQLLFSILLKLTPLQLQDSPFRAQALELRTCRVTRLDWFIEEL